MIKVYEDDIVLWVLKDYRSLSIDYNLFVISSMIEEINKIIKYNKNILTL